MLNEGLQRMQDQHAQTPKISASRNKTHKAANDDNDSSTPNANSTAEAKERSKAPLRSKINFRSNGDESASSETEKTGASDLVTSDASLSSTGLDKDAGSILMALLMQSRSGSLDIPQQADSPAATQQDEESADQPVERTPGTPTLPSINLSLAQQGLNLNPALSADGVLSPQIDRPTASSDAPDADSEAVKAVGGMPGHLAFALRLNAANGNLSMPPTDSTPSPAANELQPLNTGALKPAIESVAASSSSEKKEHSSSDSDSQHQAAFVEAPAVPFSAPGETSSTFQETAASAPPPEIDDRLHEYSTETVRNVQMQVVGEDKTRVDIRLMDRAGELRVSVKSLDSSLNQTLQDKMPELTNRLEAAQYQTEVWLPGSSSRGASSLRDSPGWVSDLEGAHTETPERIN